MSGGWEQPHDPSRARCAMTLMERFARRPAASAGGRPDQTLRRAHRLRGRVASTFTPARCWASSAKAARANPRCCPALRATCAPTWAASTYDGARRAGDVRDRAPAPVAHRLGLCPPEPARRACGWACQRGRQRRRTADGRRRAALWRDPRQGRSTGWAGSRSPPTGSTTAPRPFRAACSNACRSRATW